MSDAAVELVAPQPTGLMAWLRFDQRRVAEVEAAYDIYIRTCRPGIFAAVGLIGGIFIAIVAGALASESRISLFVPVVSVTYAIVLYIALAIPILRCPREARTTLLKGCTDAGRTCAFAVVGGLLIAIAEFTTIGLLYISHVRLPKNLPDPFAGGVIIGLIVGVVIAPISEEFLVQGWLQTRLRGVGRFWSGAIATVFFVAIHVPTNLYDLVRGGNLAFAAYVRSSTRSLGACILVHATNNAFLFAILLASRMLTHTGAHH